MRQDCAKVVNGKRITGIPRPYIFKYNYLESYRIYFLSECPQMIAELKTSLVECSAA